MMMPGLEHLLFCLVACRGRWPGWFRLRPDACPPTPHPCAAAP